MTGLSDDDRRDRDVAAVTQGTDSDHRHAYAEDRLVLPIILVAALEASGTTVDVFVHRLRHGPIWQDQSIRSPDGRIDIQAHLPPEGLRCVIRLERNMWYRHPLATLHVRGMPLPDTEEGRTGPLIRILRQDLLDTIPITSRTMTLLNPRDPETGTCIRIDMPMVEVSLNTKPSANPDGN